MHPTKHWALGYGNPIRIQQGKPQVTMALILTNGSTTWMIAGGYHDLGNVMVIC